MRTCAILLLVSLAACRQAQPPVLISHPLGTDSLQITVVRKGDTVYKTIADLSMAKGTAKDASLTILSVYKKLPIDTLQTPIIWKNELGSIALEQADVLAWCGLQMKLNPVTDTGKIKAIQALVQQIQSNQTDHSLSLKPLLYQLLPTCKSGGFRLRNQTTANPLLIEFFKTHRSMGQHLYTITNKSDTVLILR